MVLFKWNSQLSVQVSRLDDEHKQLFIMLNALHDATKDKNQMEHLETLLDEALLFLKQHFFYEEKLMLHHKYPDYALHKKAHKNLFEQVKSYKEQMNINNPFICNQILQLLRDSITPHIYSLDKQYAPFLNESLKRKYSSSELFR